MSELSILNVGTGDTKISFDPEASDAEISKASIMVKDMIRRGYAVLVEVGKDDKGPIYRRALDFDMSTTEYIVAGLPPELVEEQEEKPDATAKRNRKPDSRGRVAGHGPRSRKPVTSRVSARKSKSVAVPRTAGG
jgi:hypothetical protein